MGGKSPSYDLNLQDFLLVEGSADIYVLGYEQTQNISSYLRVYIMAATKKSNMVIILKLPIIKLLLVESLSLESIVEIFPNILHELLLIAFEIKKSCCS